jgi:hypothetical protein
MNRCPLKCPVIGEGGPAASADLVAFVLAFPAELDDGAAVAFGGPAVQPATDGDEAELAGPVLGELDEAGFDEVDGVAVPPVHLHDPPSSGQGHRWSSTPAVVGVSG